MAGIGKALTPEMLGLVGRDIADMMRMMGVRVAASDMHCPAADHRAAACAGAQFC
jgi:hypothetical protein